MINRENIGVHCPSRNTVGNGVSGHILSVEDRGGGIPEALRGRLFEPFATTKPDGMGMGLNICRSIVEMHKGHLSVEARADGGTVFFVELPVVEGKPATDTASGNKTSWDMAS